MSYESYLLNLWAWRGVVEKYSLVVADRKALGGVRTYSVVDGEKPNCSVVDLRNCSLAEFSKHSSMMVERLGVAMINAYKDKDEIDRLCFCDEKVFSLQGGVWKQVVPGRSMISSRQLSLSANKETWFDVEKWSHLGPLAVR